MNSKVFQISLSLSSLPINNSHRLRFLSLLPPFCISPLFLIYIAELSSSLPFSLVWRCTIKITESVRFLLTFSLLFFSSLHSVSSTKSSLSLSSSFLCVAVQIWFSRFVWQAHMEDTKLTIGISKPCLHVSIFLITCKDISYHSRWSIRLDGRERKRF